MFDELCALMEKAGWAGVDQVRPGVPPPPPTHSPIFVKPPRRAVSLRAVSLRAVSLRAAAGACGGCNSLPPLLLL